MIRKWILNARARFSLRTFLFNYEQSDQLDELFWAAAMSDLTIKEDTVHWLEVSFSNICIRAWNANRYYAWLNNGIVYEGEKLIFSWSGERPSAYVMWVFRNALRRSDAGNSLKGALGRAAKRQTMRVIN